MSKLPKGKLVKCTYCSKLTAVTRKGTVKPHIVHKGKQCCGGGMRADQMLKQRDRLESFFKKRLTKVVGT